MALDAATRRDPQSPHHMQVGGYYTTGINPDPGGRLRDDIFDVMPNPDRSKGISDHARMQQASISRQLGGGQTSIHRKVA